MNPEVWEDIPWYPNYKIRAIDNSIVSLNFRRTWVTKLLRSRKTTWWHIVYWLYLQWKFKNISVHRIVMLIKEWPCPEWMEVCHNDWNPLNNHPDNLRYDTRSENVKDSVRHWTHNMVWRFWSKSHLAKKVRKYTLDNIFVKEYWSFIECWIENNISKSKISDCTRGKIKSVGGFIFKVIP